MKNYPPQNLCLFRSAILAFCVGWSWAAESQTSGGLLWLSGGHGLAVNAVACSPDGRIIATASDDGTIKLWSTNGLLQKTLSTYPFQATALAFSPDGTRLAAGTGHVPTPPPSQYPSTSYLDRGLVSVWQATNGWTATNVSVLYTRTNGLGKVNAIAFSADGSLLAAGGAEGTNIIRRAANGSFVTQFAAYNVAVGPAAVTSVAFSSNGLFATACQDRTLRVWATNGWSQVWSTNTAQASNLTAVAFSPNGALLASASLDGTVCVFSTTNWSAQLLLTGHTGGVAAVAFASTGLTLASGSQDQTVKLWDARTGTCSATLSGHSAAVTSVAFSPDGSRVVSGSKDRTGRVWSAGTGAPLLTLSGHTDYVKSVAISPDGVFLASVSSDKSIQVRRLADGTLVWVLPGHTDWVSALAFAPDSTVLASSGGPFDAPIKLWCLADGTLLRAIAAQTNGVTALAFSPDGTMLASGGDFTEQNIMLWRVANGSLVRAVPGHTNGVSSLAFSPAGDILVSGGRRFDNTVKVWQTANGNLLRTFSGHTGNVEAIAFSPDGNTVASGCNRDGDIILCGLSDGSSRSFGSDTNPVVGLAFSADGSKLASATHDAVTFWNVGSGTVSQRFSQETLNISCLCFSPNGNLLFFGREDATTALAQSPLTGLGQPALAFDTINPNLNGHDLLQASGQPEVHYVIQSSTNLSDWTYVTSVVSQTNSWQITAPSAASVPDYFYRALTPP